MSIWIELGENKPPIKNPKRAINIKNGISGIFLYSFKNLLIKDVKIRLTNPEIMEIFHKIILNIS
jgi:hypothetical protein